MLYLQQLEHSHLLCFTQRTNSVPAQKLLARALLVQQYPDIVVSCRPGIAQQLTATTLKLQCRVVTQEVQRNSQRIPPHLVPTSFTSGVATAVACPTRDTVRTTPRTSLTFRPVLDLDRHFRCVTIEILAVVRDPESGFLCIDAKRVRETEIAKLEMMTIRFAIRRYVHEIAALCGTQEEFDETAAGGECFLKGDSPR